MITGLGIDIVELDKDIINEQYEFSKLIFKNRKLLILWYEYIDGVPYEEFVIRDYQSYNLSENEAIIRNDFEIIKQKVIDGLAHELSEGDTVILGAATKGQKGQTAVQPNSKIPASTRAYSLKNSFFRGVLRGHVEMRLRTKESSDFVSPGSFVWDQLKLYKGTSQLNILSCIEKRKLTDRVPNSISKMITNRLIGTDNCLREKYEVFSKSNYSIRNISIREDSSPIEKATFRTLQHSDFTTSWIDSDWKTFFEEVTLIYVAYLGMKDGNMLKNGTRLLDRVYKVTFTPEEVEDFEKTYNMIKQAIETNDVSRLPTATLNTKEKLGLKLVISTKGNSSDGYIRFLKGNRTTCFMLNKDFIHKKFNKAVVFR